MKVGIGSDAYGYHLKEHIKGHLTNSNMDCEDVRVFSSDSLEPYYDVARDMAERVVSGQFDRGILVCGTGMGMAIIANKTKGIYASVCESVYAAQKSRSINNSNILTLGEFIIAPKMAEEMVDAWLKTEFTQGWPEKMVSWLECSLDKIKEIEGGKFK